MEAKVINFKVTKIGQSSNDKLFAVLSSEKPSSTLGGLKIMGKSTVYRIELEDLPEGVELKEDKNGKMSTFDLDAIPEIPIKHQRITPLRPFEPVGYTVEEREVMGDDDVTRHYKWLVLKDI